MFPTRPPTKRRVRRLTATAAGALLAVAGMTGIAAPAQAAIRPANSPVYDNTCAGYVSAGYDGNQTQPTNRPLSCTVAGFGAWDATGTQTQSGEVTYTNGIGAPVTVTTHNDDLSVPHDLGNGQWHLFVPSGGVTLQPGRSVTLKVTFTVYGGFTPSEENPPSGGTPATVGAGFSAWTTSPVWSGYGVSSSNARYPVTGLPSYALSVSASPSSPRTGQASTVTATNTSKVSEHLALCGGGKMLAAGIHPPGGKLVHAVRRSTAGTETFTVVAGARYACSGSPSKTVTVDWTGTAPPASTAGMSVAVAGDGGEPVGHPDRLFVADTGPRGAPAEWLTMCVNGRPVASGLHAPGTVLVHAVTGPSVGSTVTVGAYADASPGACSGVERTFTVTGLSAGPTVTVTNLHAFASAASATVGAKVQTWVTDTATGPTWATLCQAGRPIASAWLHPGQGMPHAVAAATAGSVTYAAMQGKASCSSGDESSVTVSWTAAS